MTETEQASASHLTPTDYRRLVAGTIARYWAPIRRENADDADQADETDYGVADHILAALLVAGIELPGVPAHAYAGLPGDENPWDRPGNPAASDPMVHASCLMPRSMIDRLKALVFTTDHPSWQALMRRLVTEGVDTMERGACPRCGTCCTAKECADNTCIDRGCDCCPDEDNLHDPADDQDHHSVG